MTDKRRFIPSRHGKGRPPVISSGDVFGRLTVLNQSKIENRKRFYLCKCECGEKTEKSSRALTQGHTRSCGCLRREVTGAARRTHAKSLSKEYNIWGGMIQRCTNPDSHRWALYGGRGITICERWMDSASFLSDMGIAPAGMSIDRIDVNGNYEPANCRWATQKEQTRNTRRTVYLVISGVRRPMIEWCEAHGVAYSLVRDRIGRGWSAERALSEPKK